MHQLYWTVVAAPVWIWAGPLSASFCEVYLHVDVSNIPRLTKQCISRTMMEWLTLKWSATLLWLRLRLCMPTACHLSGMVNCRAPYQTNRKWNLKLYRKKSVFFRKHKCWKVHVALYIPCHIHINKNRSITCFTGK